MDHIGIDVHKKESQICILAEGGELLEQRIRTEPARFATMLSARPEGGSAMSVFQRAGFESSKPDPPEP